MTAAYICKAMDISTFNINYIYSEKLSSHYFEECPIKSLTISTIAKDKLVEEYLDRVQVEDKGMWLDNILKRYPENAGEVLQRTHKFDK